MPGFFVSELAKAAEAKMAPINEEAGKYILKKYKVVIKRLTAKHIRKA